MSVNCWYTYAIFIMYLAGGGLFFNSHHLYCPKLKTGSFQIHLLMLLHFYFSNRLFDYLNLVNREYFLLLLICNHWAVSEPISPRTWSDFFHQFYDQLLRKRNNNERGTFNRAGGWFSFILPVKAHLENTNTEIWPFFQHGGKKWNSGSFTGVV